MNNNQLECEKIVTSENPGGIIPRVPDRRHTYLTDADKKNIKVGIKKIRPIEYLIENLIRIFAFFSLASIVLIFIFVFKEASSIFFPEKNLTVSSIEEMETYGDESLGENSSIDENVIKEEKDTRSNFSSLFNFKWVPVSLNPKFGILPLLSASIMVALISVLIGAPVAIFAALYSSTFASKHIKELIKPVIEVLAGFPSVVIGFFALIVIATFLQQLFGFQYRLNAFTGGIALSLAIIPVIYTISEDALSAVPKTYIEASLALGAQKWETALFVVLPSALPGIFAAVLLGIGRAIGETMIVLMATGNAALLTMNPFMPVRTMSATIGAEMAEVVFGDFHYSVLFFIGVVLFAISFLLNFIAETVVRKMVMRRFT